MTVCASVSQVCCDLRMREQERLKKMDITQTTIKMGINDRTVEEDGSDDG